MSLLHKVFDTLLTAVSKVVDFALRRRSFPLRIFRAGLILIGATAAGSWVSSLFYADDVRALSLHIEISGGTPELITWLAFMIGLVLTAVGGVWEAIRFAEEERKEEERRARRRVVVIEQRGLAKSSGSPLKDALPKDVVGVPQSILLDHTPYVENNSVTDPERVVGEVATVRHDLERSVSDVAREDVTVVYGGVSPVPLTFLAGFLLDDDGAVRIVDWDRGEARWRSLDGADDGERFIVDGFDRVPRGAAEVAVAVEVSYAVDADAVGRSLGAVPVVRLSLPTIDKDNHWSDAKQRALAAQFLKVVSDLGNRGVRTIHLFLVAQNSVVFRLGQRYDQRNLPEVLVHQYEKTANPPHPWAVKMPTHGINRPVVVRRAPLAVQHPTDHSA
ncbi:SAVED domain-containing protein [Azospirillum brasilense]|uniref:SAVED domain-containing protein n=1 Tax=Azospirillum brasilense TaxID=192 RepID=A0A6L3B1L1_AZOBR|nr:SAVED domain-containing protein [Azospirillum brasilense]KAA0686202.1 SAVED domain-containing protein [Azospirillum brasilense]